MTSRILVVCTGNVCRSPAAALLLDRRTDDSVVVESAGTEALVGRGASAPMAALLAERGVDTSGFTARRTTPELIAGAALVVTMTRAQRSQVVGIEPRAVRRTFTLLELALLLGGVPAAAVAGEDDATRLERVPELAAGRRGVLLGARTPLDIPDPYGRPERVYRRTLGIIEPAVEAVAHVLHPPSVTLGTWSPHVARQQSKAAGFPEGPGDVDPTKGRVPRHGVRRRFL